MCLPGVVDNHLDDSGVTSNNVHDLVHFRPGVSGK